MRVRSTLAGYAGLLGALTVGYFAVPGWRVTTWALVGLCSLIAIVIGVKLHGPRRAAPWLLFASAVVAFTVADGMINFQAFVLDTQVAFPSLPHLLYLAIYPLVTAGLVTAVRSRSDNPGLGAVLDTIAVTLSVGVLAWTLLIEPNVTNPDLSLQAKLVSVGYPLGNLVVLATLTQLLTRSRVRGTSAVLVACAAVALFGGDVVYAAAHLGSGWQIAGPVDLAWVAFYGGLGAAALHPSMRCLTEPSPVAEADPEVGIGRIALLGLTAGVPPAVLVAMAPSAGTGETAAVAAAAIIVFLLVAVRLAGVVRHYRQALVRERVLGRVHAALSSAPSTDEVLAIAERAVGELLAPAQHRACVWFRTGGPPVACDGNLRSSTLFPTAELPTDVRARLGEDLPCGLLLLLDTDLPAEAESASPALLAAASEVSLRRARCSLELLAAQTAEALTRVALNDEVTRRQTEEYFRSVVQHASDIIIVINGDGLIRYATPSSARLFGAVTPGTPALSLLHRQQHAAAETMIEAVRNRRNIDEPTDWCLMRPDGTLLTVEATCKNLHGDSAVNGLVLTMRDVTEQRRLQHELTRRAYNDSLTGLGNRAHFVERLQQAAETAARTGGSVGVLLLDVDDFQAVNDTMGHHAGDELLTVLAGRLRAAVADPDDIARLGADEFAVLVTDASHPEALEQRAATLLASLRQPVTVTVGVTEHTASCGIASTAQATDGEDLLRQADVALRTAKTAGKNQWARYQAQLHELTRRRIELRAALAHALVEGDFFLHFQPIVRLDDAVPVGVEALVRWRHEVRGVVPPNEFIEVAEDSGLIVALGDWVLGEALRTLAEWRRTGQDIAAASLYVSVNVSARQFRSPGFVDRVRQALDDTGVPPSSLLLEITESLLLRDDEQVWTDLVQLRWLGVRIAIDDFGTGYSSLSYLRQFPVDVLKIDKSFLDDMAGSAQQQAVVDAILRLARTLDLTVVAEGIEEPAQRQLLLRLGCPLGQGYLFSPPVPASDVALSARRRVDAT